MSDNQQQDDIVEQLNELSETRKEMLAAIYEIDEPTTPDLQDQFGYQHDTVLSKISRIRGDLDDPDIVLHTGNCYRLGGDYRDAVGEHLVGEFENDEEEEKGDLTATEEYILQSILPATVEEIAEDREIPVEVAKTYIQTIQEKGYELNYDEKVGVWEAGDDWKLYSDKAQQTITKNASRWIQKKIEQQSKVFRTLDTPDWNFDGWNGSQDFVSVLSDVHMGDMVVNYMGETEFDGSITQQLVRYDTKKKYELYERHSEKVDFDVWHEVWLGDFLTNGGIYKHQVEDLAETLNEQHNLMMQVLMERLKFLSKRLPYVNIVCQVGNHGEHRADGQSKTANADQILYMSIRNLIAYEQQVNNNLTNIRMQIGDTAEFYDFSFRDGKVRAHARHGQHVREQDATSAAKKEWRGAQLNHVDRHDGMFDIGYMGHYHKDKRLNVGGRPVLMCGSPKPLDDFARKLNEVDDERMSICHGVSDDGMTFEYSIDLRDFDSETYDTPLGEVKLEEAPAMRDEEFRLSKVQEDDAEELAEVLIKKYGSAEQAKQRISESLNNGDTQ